MTTLIPTNLNLTEHLVKFPPINIPAFSVETLKYVIGLPFTIMANKKDLRTVNGFVPFKAERLLNDVGNNYRLYLDYLVETKIFDEDPHYIVGEKSRGFRFAEDYRIDYTIVKLGKSITGKFKKKIRKEIKKQEKLPEYQKVNHLRPWIFNGKLQLDLELAKTILHEMFLKGKVRLYEDSEQLAKQRRNDVQRSNNAIKASVNGSSKRESLTYREKQILKYYRNLHAAERLANIEDNFPYFKVDSKVFRLHSSCTGLKRELRNCLSYGGKYFYEVDIACSQPYFSLALLNPDFWGQEKGEKKNGIRLGSDKILNISYMSSSLNEAEGINKPSITLKKLLKYDKCLHKVFNKLRCTSSIIMIKDMVKDIDKEELNHYIKQVTSGYLYDYLLEQYIEHTGRKDMDRNKMKKVIFTILFSKNENEILGNTMKDIKIRQQRILAKDIFRSCFPTIMQVFEKIKEGQNNLLACLLQTIEASVILDKICWRIRRERPGLPIITIHDSILTPAGNEAYVKRIMEDEFQKAMGIVPKLTTKNLSPFYREETELYKVAA